LDEEGNFMGTVVGEGNVVLTHADIGKPIFHASDRLTTASIGTPGIRGLRGESRCAATLTGAPPFAARASTSGIVS